MIQMQPEEALAAMMQQPRLSQAPPTPMQPPTPLMSSHMQPPTPLGMMPEDAGRMSMPPPPLPGYPGTPATPGYPTTPGPPGYPPTPAPPTPLQHMEEMPHLPPDQVRRVFCVSFHNHLINSTVKLQKSTIL